MEFRVPGVDPFQEVDVRIVSDPESALTGIRFWHNDRLISAQQIRTGALPIVRF
jgi:hypothetical protein